MSFRRILPLAILLLAFALRVVAIDRIPPGLSHDEAYNGVTAMQVLDGQRLIFFEINKGIEPLIIYLEALTFYAFGISPTSMRLVNVICGLLTVALTYPLTKRLFNRRVALLAMAGLTVSFWAIFTSRLALRAVILPPLLLLTLYFLWRGLNPTFNVQRLTFLALSGLTAGATMYTYLSSRFVPLLLGAIFAYQLLRRQVTKWHWLGVLLLFLLWAIVFAPLAFYFWQHAASFTERSSQVSTLPYALNGDFGPLLRHTGRTLAMFTFHGDETDRYNLDGRPVFDWLNGLLFYLGLGLALLRLRRPASVAGPAALLLLWLFFMLLPGFITDDSPHFLRTIGALPVAYIFWAIGLDWVSQRLLEARTRGREDARSRITHHASRITHHASSFILHPSSFILLLLLHTSYDYFFRWANAAEARTIYGADIAEVARYVNATRDEGLVAISAEYYRDLDPFRFSLHSQGQPPFVIWFDGRQSLAFPPPESGLSPRYIFPKSAPPAELWQPFLQPLPAESGKEFTLFRLSPAKALRQAEAAAFPPQNRLEVTVNNDLIVSAYQLLGSVTSGGKFEILLAWQALRALPPVTDYTFLVQLQDNQGHIWATADGNGYPAGAWQPGVQGLQLLLLRLPGDLPPRAYTLTAQVVDRRSSQALPAVGGEPVIRLGSVTGQLAKTPRLLDPAKLPNPMQVVQSNGLAAELALRGYDLKSSHIRPDEALALTLHWQVLEPPAQDYHLQFFLTDEQGEVVHRWPDLPPINAEWPTRQWPADYWVQDRLDLPLGMDVPPGQFRLRATWVTGETPSSSGQTWPGFDLGQVVVNSEQ